MKFKVTLLFMAWLPVVAFAAEMDHSKMDHSQMEHSGMDHSSMNQYSDKPQPAMKGELPILRSMPASGSAREAGYDGRYGMESTTTRNKLATQCAQASRGLIMMDNATWKKCGGKPQGAAKGPSAKSEQGAAMDHSQHMQH